MSLKEIREENKLKDKIHLKNGSVIEAINNDSCKCANVKFESSEDREFYKALMELSYKTISKHLDEMGDE